MSAPTLDARRFREVLGHFPTGVVIISAIGADGSPVGMVVGSFTSVSLDPPLVAYLPSRTSKSYARLQEASHFCVSVLSAEQEDVCRRFAGSGSDKFALTKWSPAPSGSPILDGAVAWLDCEVKDRHEAGDHDIVVGRVTALGTGAPAGPLLFFQGGYGAFDSGSLAAPYRPDLRAQLRVADIARPHLEALACETRMESYSQAIAGGDLVVVAASGSPGRSVRTHIGRRLPFASPFGSLFAAFNTDLEATWFENGAAVPGSGEALTDAARIDRVRDRGWSIGLRATDHDLLWQEISAYGDAPATAAVRRRVDSALRSLADRYDPDDGELTGSDIAVRIIAAPVREVTGKVVQLVVLFGFPEAADRSAVQGWANAVVQTADAVSADLAGAI